jgi:hypothetical protein
VSPSYCTTWPSLVLARFRFLLDHVSGPCCSTCQFSIGTRVVLRLGCHFFIESCIIFLLVHVAISYLTMRPSTCHNFNSPRVVPWLFHVSCRGYPIYRSTCRASTQRIYTTIRTPKICQHNHASSAMVKAVHSLLWVLCSIPRSHVSF